MYVCLCSIHVTITCFTATQSHWQSQLLHSRSHSLAHSDSDSDSDFHWQRPGLDCQSVKGCFWLSKDVRANAFIRNGKCYQMAAKCLQKKREEDDEKRNEMKWKLREQSKNTLPRLVKWQCHMVEGALKWATGRGRWALSDMLPSSSLHTPHSSLYSFHSCSFSLSSVNDTCHYQHAWLLSYQRHWAHSLKHAHTHTVTRTHTHTHKMLWDYVYALCHFQVFCCAACLT